MVLWDLLSLRSELTSVCAIRHCGYMQVGFRGALAVRVMSCGLAVEAILSRYCPS